MTDTEKTLRKLTEAYGGSIAVEHAEGLPSVTVSVDKLREVLSTLKTDPDLSFAMLTDLFAVDCFGRTPRFEVVYLLNSLERKERLTVKVKVNDDQSVPTVSDIWAAAEWLEREAYDMFGLRFDNHPDLRRILMVEDFDGYPLRKDFPTEGYGFEEPFRVKLEEETEEVTTARNPSPSEGKVV